MPQKVRITVSNMFNPLGVRILLSEIGVVGPMLQEENVIICAMTEAQIDRFRNSKGAAHRIEVITPEEPPQPEEAPVDEAEFVEVAYETPRHWWKKFKA